VKALDPIASVEGKDTVFAQLAAGGLIGRSRGPGRTQHSDFRLWSLHSAK
jgi:hypothetical protein